MEQTNIAEKSKTNSSLKKKDGFATNPESDVSNMGDKQNQPVEKKIVTDFGLTLILDNSLKKYANEKFILEHAERAERKFAKNKTAL
jgi:hypothetical protein